MGFLMFSVIRSAIAEPASAQLHRVIEIVRDSGALDYVQEAAQAECLNAKASLETIPDSPYRDAMHALASYAQARLS